MIVAGFGCRDSVSPDALRAALDLAIGKAQPPTALATLTHKAHLIAPLAEAMGLPLLSIDPSAITGVSTPTSSAASLAAYRTGSVAEAVAMAAAGNGSRLLTLRAIAPGGGATCALAQGFPA
ncbi:hypothetical protein L288_03635 [Sphingobium quisquiliarum P25]|uniref:CobE/GbiG C-terminal domain-containing protein n=1 Tax=Sphingobium quisquiliarum P25 TaxID=1329909 RepID=T0HFU9_9SPHN|nr:cobalamin biosynthesis protein [Sphingobium quisquiliarum]EQB10998.1 hypothetical protein L288_03635 [Sphingobium quisquiliarum P25]